MFFILSKILLFLLSPAFWIIALLIWSFYTKKQRQKKVLRIISVVLFIVFTNPFLFNVCVRAWQPEPMPVPEKKYSAAILLGGVLGTDKDGRSFFGMESDRFIQTTKLYHAGAVQYVAVTGGSPFILKKAIPEADELKEELIMQGIPAANIIVENRSRNTYENAVFTKRILDSMKLPPPYIVVTSAMHIPRAKAVFKKAGVDIIAYPAAYRQIDHKRSFDDYIIPSTGLLAGWSHFLKEIFGLAVYRMTGKA